VVDAEASEAADSPGEEEEPGLEVAPTEELGEGGGARGRGASNSKFSRAPRTTGPRVTSDAPPSEECCDVAASRRFGCLPGRGGKEWRKGGGGGGPKKWQYTPSSKVC
jgi:hypothetical protein